MDVLESIRSHALNVLSGCIDVIKNKAREKNEVAVAALPSDATAQDYLQILYDTEFSCDDYRNLGVNDGELSMLVDLFYKMDMEAQAKEAASYLYGE
jgi:hypothetical protein